MQTDSFLKYILADNHSLLRYYKHNEGASLTDIKRSAFLKARDMGYAVPDHYNRLGMEYSFRGIYELSEIFTIGLTGLASDYLEIHNNRVFVRRDKFNEWQFILPLIPPLLLDVARIWKENPIGDMSLIDYASQYIAPSATYTAIPEPYMVEMARLKEEKGGFTDLHIHLNGTLETDLVWGDFIRNKTKVYKEIKDAFKDNEKVKEQFAQVIGFADPQDFHNLLNVAGMLRENLAMAVISGKYNFNSTSFKQLLIQIANNKEDFNEHPFVSLFSERKSSLILEGLFYAKCFEYMAYHKLDATFAGLFHYYLLILGLCNRLLVQQNDAFGFEQFQKYTSNNFREISEKQFERRFFQLAGNKMRNIRLIEGRFSPKDNFSDLKASIDKICHGFERFNNERINRGMPPAELTLIAHFIKKNEKRKDGDIMRYQSFIKKLDLRASALIEFLHKDHKSAALLQGADAAASEFDTPPEVFAPAFHRLREAGMRHFTYHAGEDFFHLLSGLRAIYEAVEYLGLQEGDRIGHATATGVDVSLWFENIGKNMWMRKEEYLDNLIFAYHIIGQYREESLFSVFYMLEKRIETVASELYGTHRIIQKLIDAWLLRGANPESYIARTTGLNPAESILVQYHSEEVQLKGQEIICVPTLEFFNVNDLKKIQLLVLKHIYTKRIAIETLPTSNIFIGHHHSYNTYHLNNWRKWHDEGKEIPDIVVGSDDAGIFATNIFNEYCHIYAFLDSNGGLRHNEAASYIRQLVANSERYAFR